MTTDGKLTQSHMRYKAFISYSHAADGKLAPALQSALHQFARPWYRMRAMRVFRDVTNLSVNPALWSTIQQALGESEYFLLLASPQAAASIWIAREVEFWLKQRSPDTLLLVVTAGEVRWNPEAGDFDWQTTNALPANLARVFREEPLYLDFRWVKTVDMLSLHNPTFRDTIAGIAATLHSREKDEMIGEDVRQHRRTKLIASAAVVALSVLTVIAFYQRHQAQWQRQIAVARQLAAQAELLRTQHGRLLQRSVLLAVESMRRVPSLEADQALRSGLSLFPSSITTIPHEEKVYGVTFAPDGRQLLTIGYEVVCYMWRSVTDTSSQVSVVKEIKSPN